ncbi:hypothetical protein [Nocardia sp. NPDC050710]|uniref:hypothetical protein n=1 Tax=Nocardia sp. NPDC050710 TaxID=3157220 RepID=UPI00340F72D8
MRSLQAAAHPSLEVLTIGEWDDEPLSLAPVTRLPLLRTLTAYPGTLADPLEITKLTGLEFLGLGPQEWRVLLDAGAVPRSLSAAGITVDGNQDTLSVVAIANELLALWDRPQISRTVIEGDLGPMT